RYQSQTGGGIDEEMEKISEEAAREYGYGTSLLLRLLAGSETTTGVGPLECDSGAVVEETSQQTNRKKQSRKSEDDKKKLNKMPQDKESVYDVRGCLLGHSKTISHYGLKPIRCEI
ncbi:hypothetical protein PMAYCL1PPCAC_31594, partial [Pristionchus mayeri]